MKLKDAITEAVRTQNAEKCGRIADMLRMMGHTYDDVFTMVNDLTGCSAQQWETLMYEADTLEGADGPRLEWRRR